MEVRPRKTSWEKMLGRAERDHSVPGSAKGCATLFGEKGGFARKRHHSQRVHGVLLIFQHHVHRNLQHCAGVSATLAWSHPLSSQPRSAVSSKG